MKPWQLTLVTLCATTLFVAALVAADGPDAIHVRGKVVDDATGDLVPVFKARTLVLKPGEQVHLPTGTTRPANDPGPLAILRKGSSGAYDISLPEAGDHYVVQIEADGYATAESTPLLPKNNIIQFDARLKKGGTFAGVLLQPDGKPAAGAQLILRRDNYLPGVENGRLREEPWGDRFIIVTSDAEGRYRAAERLPAMAAVLHSSGWGELKADKDGPPPTVTLKPWATVEGQLLREGKPLANQQVSMQPSFSRNDFAEGTPIRAYFRSYFATTDDQGRYSFDRVIGGRLDFRVTFGDMEHNGSMGNFNTTLELKPGERRIVNMGGSGRPVTGRVTLSDALGDAKKMPAFGTLRIVRPQLIQPANWDTLSAMDKAKLSTAFRESDIYKAYMARPQEYVVVVNPDGAFRAADVPAGNYILNIDLQAASPEDPNSYRWSAVAAKSVIVPEIPGGKSDEPLDAGTVELRPVGRPKAGDMAPPFEMATYDGKRMALADLKGKFVLIDFWATWCGPCIAQMPHLGELQKSLAADSRFVLLSVSVDDRIDEPRDYLKAHPMPWMHAWSGTLDASPARLAFGVSGIPSLWLIGPDGRILMRPSNNAMEDGFDVLGSQGRVQKQPRTDESLDALVKQFLAGN